MKRKSFKKETSLVLVNGEKETIYVHHLSHVDLILDDDERPGWIIDSSSRRNSFCSRGGFKEKEDSEIEK